MTIHPEHPFLPPVEDRDPVRRFRSRLLAPVTLWTAGSAEAGARPAGLTVGSTVVADGAPAVVLGVLDPEAEVVAAVERVGRFAVTVLEWADRNLADVFAGLAPAPGGGFATGSWTATAYGPVVAGRSWAGCVVVETRELGYGRLVVGAVDQVAVAGSGGALARWRGRYTTGPAPGT